MEGQHIISGMHCRIAAIAVRPLGPFFATGQTSADKDVTTTAIVRAKIRTGWLKRFIVCVRQYALKGTQVESVIRITLHFEFSHGAVPDGNQKEMSFRREPIRYAHASGGGP